MPYGTLWSSLYLCKQSNIGPARESIDKKLDIAKIKQNSDIFVSKNALLKKILKMNSQHLVKKFMKRLTEPEKP